MQLPRPGCARIAVLALVLACAGCSEVDRTRWSARLGSSNAQRALGERLLSGDGVEQDVDEGIAWLEKSAEGGSVDAQLRLAEIYDQRGQPGDPERVLHWFRAAAEAGDARGQIRVAEHLLATGGDQAEAYRLIESAAEAGNARAQLRQAARLAEQGGRDVEVVSLLRRSAEQGEAEAAWKLAVIGMAQRGGIDDTETLRWLQQAAETGEPGAQHALGSRYAAGAGAEQDHVKAREWYEKAANQGFAPAQEALGFVYQIGQGVDASPSEAAKWYLLAAEQNRPAAMNQLGVLYAQGLLPDPDTAERIDFFTTGGGQHVDDVAEQLEKVALIGRANNDRRAVEWYRRAIAQNYDPAMVNLAKLIREGRAGPDADPEEAVRLLQRASELGNAAGLSEMAMRHSRGEGVSQDPAESLRLMKRAAESGHGPAQLALGTMYLTGMGVPPDPKEAARWLRAAMESGELAAEVPYATLLAAGNGVVQDDAAARVIFERAAAREDPSAMWSLGLFHDEGRAGFEKNPREAVKWWQKAAKKGQRLAQARLGVAYVKGTGTRRDLVEGYAWLSASGLPETKSWVDQLEKELPKPMLDRGRKLAEERRALNPPPLPPAVKG
jgi:uncharacterized protein